MNQKLLFNDGWEFAKSGLDASAPTGLKFQPVDLPHDWLIEDTSNLYENSIGWYRKRFRCPAADRVLLAFDGVYMNSTVYVNQQKVGEWKYGYSTFEHEITTALRTGENEILVKVVHQAPNSRWYSGAGIYRNVWLKLRGENFIVTDGVYFSPRILDSAANRWLVTVQTELHLATKAELT
ncbi:MAG TPA: glycoside hydrolase family 2, partial [Firmicutes bacterium]|nr:glycoside hydrolase family 2 [Bacillota bacterium]